MKESLFATPKDVQDFVRKWHDDTDTYISFPRALEILKRNGKLKKDPPSFPRFPEHLTPEQFEDLILSIPFDAENIIRMSRQEFQSRSIDEDSMFPSEKDIFCFKHMPFMDQKPHSHDFFEITYIYKGSCTLLFESQKLELNQGELCIIPPRSPHNQPINDNSLALGIAVRKSTFNALFGNLLTHEDLVSTFFRNFLYESNSINYLLLKTELLPQLREIIHQMVYESYVNEPYANTCCVSYFNLFLAHVLRRYRDKITVYRMDQLIEEHHEVPLILQYIQQNYQSVTLATLAQVFHYSESHICRLIQKNLNKNFTSVVRNLKMARAQEYLANSTMKISEISELVGYDSVDHFSRTFKKTFGVSPSRYKDGGTPPSDR